MTSFLIKASALFLLIASAAHARGIFQTNELQPAFASECGPLQVISAVAPEPPCPTAIEKPPVNFPTEVSAPRVVGHTYHIFKTVLKPQSFRQMVIIPYLQRYVRTFQAPVLETVHIQREIPF